MPQLWDVACLSHKSEKWDCGVSNLIHDESKAQENYFVPLKKTKRNMQRSFLCSLSF